MTPSPLAHDLGDVMALVVLFIATIYGLALYGLAL